jgi:hypothetical protein
VDKDAIKKVFLILRFFKAFIQKKAEYLKQTSSNNFKSTTLKIIRVFLIRVNP